MNAIIVLFTILFITGIGFSIIWGFNLLPRKDNWLAFSYSYGLGIGCIAMQLYMYSRLNIPWHKELLIIPWIILAGIILIRNKNNINLRLPKIRRLNKIEMLLLTVIVFACCYVVFEALLRPVTVWDGWATWLLKAKIFFLEGRIDLGILSQIRSDDYPLVVNLLSIFIYSMLGRVDDTAVLLTSTAFFLFLALALFIVLKNRFGRFYALLFTMLFITTQNFIRHGGRLEAGQADIPIGYYAFVCCLLLFEYLKNSSYKVFLLLNVFLALISMVKFEGIPIAIVIELFALFHIYKQKLYKHVLFIFIWIFPILEWYLYKKIYSFEYNYFTIHQVLFSIPKTVDSVIGTLKELINIKSWNMLWIIYFYSFFVFKLKMNTEQIILNSIILSQLFIYLFIYIFTSNNNPESSIERLLIHIAPLALYYIAVIIGKNNSIKEFIDKKINVIK